MLEQGLHRDSPPVQVHGGDCWNAGKRTRGISLDQARRALTEGAKACGACRPHSALGSWRGSAAEPTWASYRAQLAHWADGRVLLRVSSRGRCVRCRGPACRRATVGPDPQVGWPWDVGFARRAAPTMVQVVRVDRLWDGA
ncbi:DUF6233 domain-containing protein [Streptomyces sp. NPDC053750]|uniref:DUF6233 domain-containing protein n=1 Tax=Streptomyces sp. NPDC053750 TaxID=3365714 RepID=UPI0037D785F2